MQNTATSFFIPFENLLLLGCGLVAASAVLGLLHALHKRAHQKPGNKEHLTAAMVALVGSIALAAALQTGTVDSIFGVARTVNTSVQQGITTTPQQPAAAPVAPVAPAAH